MDSGSGAIAVEPRTYPWGENDTLSVVPAQDEHAISIATRVSLADAQEMRRCSGGMYLTPTLLLAVQHTQGGHAAVDQSGACMAIWGYTDTEEARLLWMLAAEDIKRVPKSFSRVVRTEVAELMGAGVTKVIAYSDAENAHHHPWLVYLGFVAEGKIEIHGHEFLVFEYRPED